MARRKKGRSVHGWLIIDKPAGMTSSAVVNKIKWAFEARKAGHAGTLDPAATGLLAVALGEATKTVPHITDARKTYRFTIRWGAETSTDDAEGDTLRTRAERPSREAILAALPDFTGDILQVPPQVSAVKVDGERAYALAREGVEMDLAPRPLHVERLDLIDMPDADSAVLEMVCGKGGYVRSIARDLGRTLGCLGHVTTLRRLATGPFDVADAVGMDEVIRLERTEAIDALLLPVAAGLDGLPEVTVTPEAAARLALGNPAPVLTSGGAEYGDLVWAARDGLPVALGAYMGGTLHPNRVFVYADAP
jgi:tRNA pseudouridine55 synthase